MKSQRATATSILHRKAWPQRLDSKTDKHPDYKSDSEGQSWGMKTSGLGRRRASTTTTGSSTILSLPHILLMAICLLALSCTPIEAAGPRDRLFRKSEFARYELRGEILIDRRPPPQGPPLNLHRRQGDPFAEVSSTTESSIGPTPTSTKSSTAKSTASTSISGQTSATIPSMTSGPSGSTSMASATAPASTSPLPKPFDTSLGSNFTSTTCEPFFESFLSNTTFESCLPFSLLLQNSNSFFTAERSFDSITATLDATCQVNFNTCSTLMNALALELRSDSNCGADYADENSLVRQAYSGLLAYVPLYQASCLKTSSNSASSSNSDAHYCFADAITNSSSPTDAYVYNLPLGIALPGGSRPTCSTCLQMTMNTFAEYAGNLTQPISSTYVSAATQIDSGCGPSFVNASVTPIEGSASSAAVSLKLGALRGGAWGELSGLTVMSLGFSVLLSMGLLA
ncbi:hypothetical protein MMC25_000225 [Agyrium rufum]|nr:hypothetical protein [Agyrium rufum]